MRIATVSVAGLFLMACADAGGQSGTEGRGGVQCTIVSTHAIGPNEQTVAGTPADLASSVSGAHIVPMRWYSLNGSSSFFDTELTLTLTADPSSAKLIEQTGPDGGSQRCGPLLELDATLRFETADGKFTELFVGVLRKDSISEGPCFAAVLPVAQHQGTYDLGALSSTRLNPVLDVLTCMNPSIWGRLTLDGQDPDSNPNTILTVPTLAEWPHGEAAIEAGVLMDAGTGG